MGDSVTDNGMAETEMYVEGRSVLKYEYVCEWKVYMSTTLCYRLQSLRTKARACDLEQSYQIRIKMVMCSSGNVPPTFAHVLLAY